MDKTIISKKSPCKSCPYRKDAPLQLWSIEEFRTLLENDRDMIGAAYLCHKKDGHSCVGFMINQRERDIPSIALRLIMRKQHITPDQLDVLHCNVPMYVSVEEMIEANFPELLEDSGR